MSQNQIISFGVQKLAYHPRFSQPNGLLEMHYEVMHHEIVNLYSTVCVKPPMGYQRFDCGPSRLRMHYSDLLYCTCASASLQHCKQKLETIRKGTLVTPRLVCAPLAVNGISNSHFLCGGRAFVVRIF